MKQHKKLVGAILLVILLIAGIVLLQMALNPSPNSSNDKPSVTNAAALGNPGGYAIATADKEYFPKTKGFYAEPEVDGTFPGVILIHEWWGLNDNIKDMAKQLASNGYHVLAVDLYGGKVAKTPEEARKYTSSIDQAQSIANMKAALAFLKEEGAIKVAALGWCFGGGQAMQLAVSGEKMDATVIYYGDLETDSSTLSAINWPVLGIFGDKDQSIKVETVNEFDMALDGLGIENEIYIYPGVGHAFANPSGQNYAPEATKDAWAKTTSFLEKHLKENS